MWKKESEEEESIVFLFSRQDEPGALSQSQLHMPERVQYMISDPNTLFSYLDQRRAWAQSVYLCQDLAREYQRLLHAQRAVMLSLLRNNSHFVKLKNQLSIQREQLRAKLDFFNQSLSFDLEKYREQAQIGGVALEKMASAWEKTKKDVEKYDVFLEQQGELYAQCEAMSTRINELNRSPYCRSKTQDVLGDIKKKAVSLYQKLIETRKENRHQNSDNKPMIDCVIHSVSNRERLTPDLSTHISKVSACISDLLQLITRLESSLKETESICRNLHNLQLSRQKGVWKMVSMPLQQRLPQGNSPSSAMPLSPTGGFGALEKSAEESMQIMSQAQSNRERLKSMFSAITAAPLETQMDWGFLSRSAPQLRWENADESMRI